MMDLNVRCQFCERFIPVQADKSMTVRIRCSDRKCKQWNDIKVVFLSDERRSHHDTTPLENDKIKKELAELKSKIELADNKSKEYEVLMSKLADAEEYAKQLESIIDGQV
jgi:phage FluMu protein Com